MAKPDGFLLEELESQEEFVEIQTPDFDSTYADIKSLIFTGFIPIRIKFGNLNLLLKAITPKEYEYIDMIAQTDMERVPLYFLYSLILVDSYEVIPNRIELHDYIQDLFKRLPGLLIRRIFTVVSQIQEHYSSCYERLEAYIYERESRYRWDIYKTKMINNTLFRGIDAIGYNTAQEVWIGFNQREDERAEMDRTFANAKFVASAFAGSKEIKKIERMEKMRENEENLRRQNVRLKNKINKVQLTKTITSAKDLVDELKRQINGEKDLHDKLIEIHERKMAKEAQERRDKLEELQLQARLTNTQANHRGKGVYGSSKHVTAEEMKAKMAETKQQAANYNPSTDYFMSKVHQTSQSRREEDAQQPQRPSEPKKSIFDPDIQKELANINIKGK